ncbi:TonB-dependent receptor [uncultured Sphingomonas sp.]|uniref:TonB-dependent receptor n=1 Tax=uncultured Sphingomonas sp. TaxID=158754 RepID=UPI0035CA9AE1
MPALPRLVLSASTLILPACLWSADAQAQATSTAAADRDDILVTAQKQTRTIENAPATRATITAAQIADTVNAVNIEDTLKYLPSLVVRKRHIGDTQAPLATRTSGLGASARSLIYADGALLSSLIGNNNTSASPRWSLVGPEEIAGIDVLYGPFSAAYAGNSIGAVVNITTRLPDGLEGSVTAGTSLQTFDQYGTDRALPSYQVGVTLGDRLGPLALFGSIVRTTSNGQPLAYVTGIRPAAPSATGVGTTGGYDDVNRIARPIRVFGASGLEHQVQDTVKLKAALDLSSTIRLTYVGGLFRNDTDAGVETYLTGNASGLPVYISPAAPATPLNIGGYAYAIAPAAFSAGIYRYDERHWSHALSATGSGGPVDWQVIGTLYDFDRDVQRTPTGALPGAFAGGPGTIVRLDGTGWATFDARAAWRIKAGGDIILSAGLHWDKFTVKSNRYATTDWIAGGEGALNLVSRGRTQTMALWAQGEMRLAAPLTLTLGGRYEGWRADDGFNYSLSPALSVVQPTRTAAGFSPKASITYQPAANWSVRLSFGKAYRFPTVGELYQAIATGTVLTVPDPTLKPERALSEELALENRDDRGSLRLSLFNESIRDALISQSAPLVPGSSTLFTYVQNVDRTRARGVEIAFARTDLPVRRIDLSGSVTYADATTRADTAFPAAVGKLLPSVPRWKATGLVTWRPVDAVALTVAGRYASRNYATLDNSDVVGNTYQGFYRYFVVDLRASFRITDSYSFALGIDNVNNDRYFLFHPFTQRTFHAEVRLKL